MRYLAYDFFLIGNIASTTILFTTSSTNLPHILVWKQNVCKILYFKYCPLIAMQIILQTENIPISKSKNNIYI